MPFETAHNRAVRKGKEHAGARRAEALLRTCVDRVLAQLPRAQELIATHQILVIHPDHKLAEDAHPETVAACAAMPPGEPFVLLMPLEALYYDGAVQDPLEEGQIAISVMISDTECHALIGLAAELGKALSAGKADHVPAGTD